MIFIKYIYVLFLFIAVSSCGTLLNKPKKNLTSASEKVKEIEVLPKEKIVATFGKTKLREDELRFQIGTFVNLDSMDNETVLSEVTKKRLFIEEAKNQGYELRDEFEEEIETYKKIILKNYLNEEEIINQIKKQSFENYQYELNASHIFIPISQNASPEDTLKLYNELIGLRTFAIQKDNFSLLAKDWSKDQKTNEKGGNLGWFTALHLIYPLELAAYNTHVDSISKPVRTNFGYHLIKINAKRKNSGKVKVQHIFKYLKPGYSKDEFDVNMNFLDSLKSKLDRGASFNEFVVRFSDDLNSKDKFGEYPIFGIGTREESSFEEASFSLMEGQVSPPIRSSSGLHLIRLIKKYPPDGKVEFYNSINEKVKTDSRGDFLESVYISKLKKQLNLIENTSILIQCEFYADEKLSERKWVNVDGDIGNFVLFQIDKTNFLVKDFFKFIEDRQAYERWRSTETPKQIMRLLYQKFLDKNLKEINQNKITTTNPEVKLILDSQRDDLLYSRYYDDNVIIKSLNDTSGLRDYFNKNIVLFSPKETGTVIVNTFKNEDIFNSYSEQKKKEKPYQLYRGILPMFFLKNNAVLESEDKRKLIGLLSILQKNPGYRVEVGGHQDLNETGNISALRLRNIVTFLVENGLPLTRILEVDFKNTKPHDRFDWSKNQRVSFQFFSDYESDLIKLFTQKDPSSIITSKNLIDKNTFTAIYSLPWENKKSQLTKNGKIEEIELKVKNNTSTFGVPRAVVLDSYQKYLENKLYNSLKEKYKVEINSEFFNDIVKQLK